jgi:hypothetical protein
MNELGHVNSFTCPFSREMNDIGHVNSFTCPFSGKLNDIGHVNLTTNKDRDIIQLREVSLSFYRRNQQDSR